tara:strand:- start:1113 stop:1460 length:348 start_codon:yes stop_codon:yes gene_type:complete
MDTKKIQTRLAKFAKERNWDQFHSPKNLSMALSVEVAELVEIFQWLNTGDLDEIKSLNKINNVEEEVADIFIYLLRISNKLDLDLEKIIDAKISTNEKKYPIKKSYGTSKKYSDL